MMDTPEPRQHVVLVTPDGDGGWTLTVPTDPRVRVEASTITQGLRDLADAWVGTGEAPPPTPVVPRPAPLSIDQIKPDVEFWRKIRKP